MNATPAPNAWTAPKPRELPELRARIADFAGSDRSITAVAKAINEGSPSMLAYVPGIGDHLSPGTVSSSLMSELERRRLKDAALWYADEDMSSLAVATSQTPPNEVFAKRRLPSQTGLMVFSEPIGGYTIPMRDAVDAWSLARPELRITTPVVGASWSHWTANDIRVGEPNRVKWLTRDGTELRQIRPDFEGVWITFYGAAHNRFGEIPPDAPISRRADGSIMTADDYARTTADDVPELAWETEIVIAWGADLSQPPQPDSAGEWANVLYTSWQLMTPRVRKNFTTTEVVQPNRARRRRDVRDGITGSSEVRIVRVHPDHRPSREASELDAARSSGRRAPNWTCRWPVSPHRRFACLNPRGHAEGDCEHEDTFVRKHTKGPEGLPFRTPKTVHLWDSQPSD